MAPIPSYLIQAFTAFSSLSSRHDQSIGSFSLSNPNGVEMRSPISTAHLDVDLPRASMPEPLLLLPREGTHTIVKGDTFWALAASLNVPLADLLAANPNANPTSLQVGQVINIPGGKTTTPASNAAVFVEIPSTNNYVSYSGPASNFPSMSQWAAWDKLWNINVPLMNLHDTAEEIGFIKSAILDIASSSGVDSRFILCIMMQESGGNVHVPNTNNGVTNTGLLQAHAGVGFDPANPSGSIRQMISDGAAGTNSGDGLKQVLAKRNGNYYEAARAYNSGSVNAGDLGDGFTATGDYVQKVANRLLGHQWSGM